VTALGDLLGAINAAPRLPGARCVGLSETFDPAPPGTQPVAQAQRTAAAVAICRACPAITACRSWWDGLRPCDRPVGIVAGRVSVPGAKPRRAPRPDLAEALDIALRADPHITDREHAERIECFAGTVTKTRRALEAAGHIPRVRFQGGRKRKILQQNGITA
jgi:WhiB family redox-sensing transcriptional regulator